MHPQTLRKIERSHLTMKNVVKQKSATYQNS
jgi:hypothetical protein